MTPVISGPLAFLEFAVDARPGSHSNAIQPEATEAARQEAMKGQDSRPRAGRRSPRHRHPRNNSLACLSSGWPLHGRRKTGRTFLTNCTRSFCRTGKLYVGHGIKCIHTTPWGAARPVRMTQAPDKLFVLGPGATRLRHFGLPASPVHGQRALERALDEATPAVLWMVSRPGATEVLLREATRLPSRRRARLGALLTLHPPRTSGAAEMGISRPGYIARAKHKSGDTTVRSPALSPLRRP